LHGCELAEFLTKRKRRVIMVHNGPEEELGDRMTVDDITTLWTWLKQNSVPIWAGVEYMQVNDRGVRVKLQDQRQITLKGKHIITTQDWGPNEAIQNQLDGLVPETHIIGSCREPALIIDAMHEGTELGLSI
jgi:hypothetical protein